MYVSIGGNTVVKKSEIIAVCDIDNTTTAKSSRDFLNLAEKNGALINIAEDIPKAFVVAERNGKITVYMSQLSPATLQKRVSGTAWI